MILKSKKLVFSINLDQQTSRKKRLFWSMALFLANWPILGQIGQFNPNDPKWQKSGWNLTFIHFLCVSTVSHPITSLSFTIATLVHWLTPDVFDWIHAACAFRPEPPLCFFFYSLQGWCIVHGLDANWHKFRMVYDTCCSDSGSQSCTIWESETGVCLSACGTSRIQLLNWR